MYLKIIIFLFPNVCFSYEPLIKMTFRVELFHTNMSDINSVRWSGLKGRIRASVVCLAAGFNTTLYFSLLPVLVALELM